MIFDICTWLCVFIPNFVQLYRNSCSRSEQVSQTMLLVKLKMADGLPNANIIFELFAFKQNVQDIESNLTSNACICYCRQSWATQYYHDVVKDVVRIGVDLSHKEEAARCLSDQFPRGRDIYEICDPWESSCQLAFDAPARQFRQSQTEICPGSKIMGDSRMYFLFSGAVQSGERGITVAHATKPDDEIVLQSDDASSVGASTIGRCLETYDKLQSQTGEEITADLALLDLISNECSVHNTLRWPIPSGRTLQIKIYKDRGVPDDTAVMILDQNGDFQYGNIRRDHLTDTRLQAKDLHNVLAICKREMSITQPGDSGALAMSLPSKDSDVVHVYGIVTHIYTDNTNNTSLTVANSLWDVIRELCTNCNYNTELQNNNVIVDNIDFI